MSQETLPRTHIGNRGVQRTNTAPAVEALKQYSAERAADDPAKLDKAARTVRAGLQRGRLTPEDFIRGLVDSAPALSAEQIQRLRDLLPPVPAGRSSRAGARAA